MLQKVRARFAVKCVQRRLFSTASNTSVLIETDELESLINQGDESLTIFNATYKLGEQDPR